MKNLETRPETNIGKMEAISNDGWMAAKENVDKIMANVNHEIVVLHLEQFRIPAAARLSCQNAELTSKLVCLRADSKLDNFPHLLDKDAAEEPFKAERDNFDQGQVKVQ